jgi:hypothetical protein
MPAADDRRNGEAAQYQGDDKSNSAEAGRYKRRTKINVFKGEYESEEEGASLRFEQTRSKKSVVVIGVIGVVVAALLAAYQTLPATTKAAPKAEQLLKPAGTVEAAPPASTRSTASPTP